MQTEVGCSTVPWSLAGVLTLVRGASSWKAARDQVYHLPLPMTSFCVQMPRFATQRLLFMACLDGCQWNRGVPGAPEVDTDALECPPAGLHLRFLFATSCKLRWAYSTRHEHERSTFNLAEGQKEDPRLQRPELVETRDLQPWSHWSPSLSAKRARRSLSSRIRLSELGGHKRRC